MIQIFNNVKRLIIMAVMLFNICNQNLQTRKACMSDWDVWLYPEIQRAWDLYTNAEKPYDEERRVLELEKED